MILTPGSHMYLMGGQSYPDQRGAIMECTRCRREKNSDGLQTCTRCRAQRRANRARRVAADPLGTRARHAATVRESRRRMKLRLVEEQTYKVPGYTISYVCLTASAR